MSKKIIVCILLVALLVGCAPESAGEVRLGEGATMRRVDCETGIVCYTYRGSYGVGISCLQMTEKTFDDFCQ